MICGVLPKIQCCGCKCECQAFAKIMQLPKGLKKIVQLLNPEADNTQSGEVPKEPWITRPKNVLTLAVGLFEDWRRGR